MVVNALSHASYSMSFRGSGLTLTLTVCCWLISAKLTIPWMFYSPCRCKYSTDFKLIKCFIFSGQTGWKLSVEKL